MEVRARADNRKETNINELLFSLCEESCSPYVSAGNYYSQAAHFLCAADAGTTASLALLLDFWS